MNLRSTTRSIFEALKVRVARQFRRPLMKALVFTAIGSVIFFTGGTAAVLGVVGGKAGLAFLVVKLGGTTLATNGVGITITAAVLFVTGKVISSALSICRSIANWFSSTPAEAISSAAVISEAMNNDYSIAYPLRKVSADLTAQSSVQSGVTTLLSNTSANNSVNPVYRSVLASFSVPVSSYTAKIESSVAAVRNIEISTFQTARVVPRQAMKPIVNPVSVSIAPAANNLSKVAIASTSAIITVVPSDDETEVKPVSTIVVAPHDVMVEGAAGRVVTTSTTASIATVIAPVTITKAEAQPIVQQASAPNSVLSAVVVDEGKSKVTDGAAVTDVTVATNGATFSPTFSMASPLLSPQLEASLSSTRLAVSLLDLSVVANKQSPVQKTEPTSSTVVASATQPAERVVVAPQATASSANNSNALFFSSKVENKGKSRKNRGGKKRQPDINVPSI